MADRFTHPDDYTGDRCKGKRIGTLWYSENQDSGDVTVSEYYDSLDSIQKLDLLGDIIGMLNREYKVAQDEFHAEYATYGEKNGSADT